MTDSQHDAPTNQSKGGRSLLQTVAIVAGLLVLCSGLTSVGVIISLAMIGQSLDNQFQGSQRFKATTGHGTLSGQFEPSAARYPRVSQALRA